VAAVLAIEGAHALEGKLSSVDDLSQAGFRMISLTHFFDTEFAGSSTGVEKHGLTDLGRQLIKRFEEASILVDLAHASPQTIEDVTSMATRPVVVSHSGVRATCDSRRNLSDTEIRTVADTGGLIGIGYFPGAVCGNDTPSIVRAIRHAVDLVGAEHVALGSDFDGAVRMPFDATGLVLLTDALLKDGFSEQQIRSIMGENVLRLVLRSLP
jgi:microsomal dipeptidase-like Zn-dependent dipeptidase